MIGSETAFRPMLSMWTFDHFHIIFLNQAQFNVFNFMLLQECVKA